MLRPNISSRHLRRPRPLERPSFCPVLPFLVPRRGFAIERLPVTRSDRQGGARWSDAVPLKSPFDVVEEFPGCVVDAAYELR